MTSVPRALLIVKYGKKSGTGHLYRTLTLTHYIPYEVQLGLYLLPEEGQEKINLALSSFESKIHLVEKEVSVKEFDPDIVIADVLSDEMIEQHTKYLLNESLYPPFLWQLSFSNPCINITDSRIKKHLRGLNIIANQYTYQYRETLLRKHCLVVGGRSCIVLGKNNRLLQCSNRYPEPHVKSILIIASSYATTSYIEDLLVMFQVFPKLSVKLIAGIPLPECILIPPNIKYVSRRISHKDLLEQIVSHDVVITNEGQSKIDSISLGVPTIVIPLCDDASIPFQDFQALDVCVHTPKYTHQNFERIKTCIHSFLANYSLRMRLAKSGSTMISDEGLKSSITRFLTNEVEKVRTNI